MDYKCNVGSGCVHEHGPRVSGSFDPLTDEPEGGDTGDEEAAAADVLHFHSGSLCSVCSICEVQTHDRNNRNVVL